MHRSITGNPLLATVGLRDCREEKYLLEMFPSQISRVTQVLSWQKHN